MTNDELLEKMFKELDGTYQLGLHSVSKFSYDQKITWGKKERYYIDKENITEEDIVAKILNEGLNVYETCIGLRSTVKFQGYINSISSDVFNYVYWDKSSGQSYTIIVVIPQYICIKGREYFIGDIVTETVNIASFSMFYSLLPKEFIYGYYVKKYVVDESDKLIFDDEINFFPNPNFYDLIPDKEEFWLQYLNKNKIRLSVLNAANYPNLFNNLFQNSRNRHAIECTKYQIKKLENR